MGAGPEIKRRFWGCCWAGCAAAGTRGRWRGQGGWACRDLRLAATSAGEPAVRLPSSFLQPPANLLRSPKPRHRLEAWRQGP